MEKIIYLDYNATTPVHPEVAEAMRPYLAHVYGNPSSIHSFGADAKKAVEKARQQVAALINCYPDEVVFTSGGTESNNYAIKGAAFGYRDKGSHIITTAIEHPSVSEVCRFLETAGLRVTYVGVDQYGMVDPDEIEKAITRGTILISVMHANNETGTLQPVEEIGKIAGKHGILFHTDAAQSPGKIPVDVREAGTGLLSLAGHKFYSPKGIGALFIKRGIKLQSLMHGAGHETGRRAGTENVPEIVGLGKAAEIALRDLGTNATHMKEMSDRLFARLSEHLPGIRLNGHPEKRLPNTLFVSFPGVSANMLLDGLPLLAASAGAACHGADTSISGVLRAMNVEDELALGTVRFSAGSFTTADEIDRAAGMIIEAVRRLGSNGYDETAAAGEGEPVRLTRFTRGLGCACKIRPQYLERILKDMPLVSDKNVLLGAGTSDDAAVYRIDETTALVQSVDFFTPVVDDPADFGAIAAANALSDIYAMGAMPLFGLNIVGFPSNRLPEQVLRDILKGAGDKCREAGVSVLGGHTVEDTEPKFGMVVTGIVHPGKFITNSGAKPGDVLVLTKPLGTGIISTAVKRQLAGPELALKAVAVMSSLNAGAARAMEKFPVNACTDITGFGLLGHLKEMVSASGVQVHIESSEVPVIEGIFELAAAGAVPGGTVNNLEYVSGITRWNENVSETMKLILCDAQTSGGLLVSLPAEYERQFIERLHKVGVSAGVVIGKVTGTGRAEITVT
ncbi:MAG: selenide, water dikinase SelD [Marinilabiliales bacterium]|nr:MAG: selenide, water dikinase SelD [Marinilabiliales bacterium]